MKIAGNNRSYHYIYELSASEEKELITRSAALLVSTAHAAVPDEDSDNLDGDSDIYHDEDSGRNISEFVNELDETV